MLSRHRVKSWGEGWVNGVQSFFGLWLGLMNGFLRRPPARPHSRTNCRALGSRKLLTPIPASITPLSATMPGSPKHDDTRFEIELEGAKPTSECQRANEAFPVADARQRARGVRGEEVESLRSQCPSRQAAATHASSCVTLAVTGSSESILFARKLCHFSRSIGNRFIRSQYETARQLPPAAPTRLCSWGKCKFPGHEWANRLRFVVLYKRAGFVTGDGRCRLGGFHFRRSAHPTAGWLCQ